MAAVIYRQIAWKLRWHAADRSQKSSERPSRPVRGGRVFLDFPPAPPTLVQFAEGDEVDERELLKIGAIVPYEPPEEGGSST